MSAIRKMRYFRATGCAEIAYPVAKWGSSMLLKMYILTLLAVSTQAACAAPVAQGAQAGERDHSSDVPQSLAAGLPPGSTGAATAAGADARIGSHGMVLTGSPVQVQLSHIPMFHKPHDVQLIMQASVTSVALLPTTFSDQLYTFLPEPLSLDALRTGKLTRMEGTLYKGNFEDGGVPVMRITVTVTRIVHQHVLDASEPATQAQYFAMGTQNDAVLIHRIAGSPGYDQVIHASLKGLSDAQLANGVALAAKPGTGDSLKTRLNVPQTLALAPATQVIVTPIQELSCLVGPHFAETCPK
jgi:hypothetical protein